RKVVNELGYVHEYGYLQGFLGLREQFARQLADRSIQAHPSQMVTTAGVSAGITTIVQALCQYGDTVLIDDPTWFWIIGCLQNMGINVIGVTRTADGVDLEQLATILRHYQPKLYITNSTLQNPTSYNVSPTHVFAVLKLMEEYDCYVVEDDIYSHFHSDKKVVRYATLDGFQRVFYLDGVSKVLGGNWRVGLVVCPERHLQAVLRQKMLSHMTCPELNERIISHIWQQPEFYKHISRVQSRLIKAHNDLLKRLRSHGFTTPIDNNPCLFVWLDVGVDTAELALHAHKAGWLVAPSHLFSPTARFKTHIRLNVTRTTDEFLAWLREYVDSVDNGE
ncbi:MAG: PLP-dependent aminotransferase family protein, partial [Moraxellaceae bacterium]|nr:PLP-dependent aminotransferase family protein [Moraxellaceae bacterium]MBS9779890.1 PLP-dependent aminotransferase family protein [Moraxellaceae bacterium]